MTQLPQIPSSISDIPAVGGDYYENIFNIYNTDDDKQFYFFNLGRKVVINLDNVDQSYIEYIYTDARMPLTTLSYRLFNTIHPVSYTHLTLPTTSRV